MDLVQFVSKMLFRGGDILQFKKILKFPKDYTSRIHSNQYNNYMTAHCPTEVSLAVQYLKKAEN